MQLIVLGMHRSGTSAVTRLLNLAGAYFGPEGIATDPNEENPKGFWERRDVRAACDGLLLGGGYDWWRVADFDLDRIGEATRAEHLGTLRRTILDLDAHRPWVVKEPRLSLLTPLVRPLLEAPVFVHVEREPLEIAESLRERNGFPIPVGVALWETYTVHSLAASTGDPRVLVSYGDLMRDPVATTQRLVDDLGALGVPSLRMPSEREITGFVTPSLHRQRERAELRREHLNEQQAALARAFDQRELPEVSSPPTVSAGATATLLDLEARTDLATEQATEIEDLHATHREAVDALRESHRLAEEAMRAERQDAERVLRAEHEAEVSRLRDAARRADAELVVAQERIRAVERSRALRVGARLSSVRDRMRGAPRGVRVAVTGAGSRVDEARRLLSIADDDDLDVDTADAPPTANELQRRRSTVRAAGGRPKVAVLAWDVGHNPFGRAHLLADLLRGRYDVEIWGCQFERYGTGIWPPFRSTSIPVRRLRGAPFPELLDRLDDAAKRIDADALYVSKPRFPSLGLGILAKEHWNRPLLVDVDDFEPSFFEASDGLDPEGLFRRLDDPDLLVPHGGLWTRACDEAARGADQLTVSNPQLELRYGGLVVPHARDESVFDPDRFDRAAVRRRLGLGDDDKLLLFGGTPRAHKGLVDLLKALDELGDPRLRAGVLKSKELDELLRDHKALGRWILPLRSPSFDELPELLAAVDVSCVLQSVDHPVSGYQMPAKITDAMAMGVPCLVTPVPPVQPLIDKGVVEVYDGAGPLAARIEALFADPVATADRAARARELFLEAFSFAAVSPALADAVAQLLDDAPAARAPLSALTRTARQIFRPSTLASRPPAARPRVPAGATYDLAIFWKQNDTGIYGRRQDMFLKYLEASGRFGSIVHFDRPMSLEALLALARQSRAHHDQSRMVLAQTLRRLTRRGDQGKVRHRTFLYSASGRTRRLPWLPRRSDQARWVQQELRQAGFGTRPLMCWVYPTNPFFDEVVDALAPDVVVADVVDDNRSWYEPGTPMYEQVEQSYRDTLARSDVVLANCEPVAESMRSFAPSIDVVPNACELRDDPPPPVPRELAGSTRPIIGYAGNLSDRIDVDLLRELARARRGWTFVLMGSAHRDPSALALAKEPNVQLLGTRRYEEARNIIRHFDVALIPHLDNDMTRSMNPLKAFVYCSIGVPVVSTPVANLGELEGLITIAEGTDGFLHAIEAALAAGRSEPDLDALRSHSWEVRVQQVMDRVDSVTERRPGTAHG